MSEIIQNAAYALLRVDSEGCGYDSDYPIESVFLSRMAAETYMRRAIDEMIADGELDDDVDDDEVFVIEKVPLVTVSEDEL